MPLEKLKIGLRHSQSLLVVEGLTVPAVSPAFASFAAMPPVFATAFVVAFVEWTCVEGLRPFLAPAQDTVGVHVDLSHCAATPVGMRVTADVELVAIQGRRVRFKCICRDEADLISEGYHDRFIVDVPRFMSRLEKKIALTSGG